MTTLGLVGTASTAHILHLNLLLVLVVLIRGWFIGPLQTDLSFGERLLKLHLFLALPHDIVSDCATKDTDKCSAEYKPKQ